MILVNELPGANELLDRMVSVRNRAFLAIPHTICGVDALPLTLGHLQILDAIQSPFITRARDITSADIAQFLWIVSPGWRPPDTFIDRWRQDRFIKHSRKLPFVEAASAIGEYLDDAFLDAPPQTGGDGPRKAPSVSFTASLVHCIASAYGWTRSEIATIPMAEIWQYIKIITEGKYNPIDTIIDREIERMNAEANQQEAAV